MQPSSISISNPAAVSPFYLGVSFLICPALPCSLLPCQTAAHKQLRRPCGPSAKAQTNGHLPSCWPGANAPPPSLAHCHFGPRRLDNGRGKTWHVGEISSFSILAHLLELDARSDPSACRSSMCNPTYKPITPT